MSGKKEKKAPAEAGAKVVRKRKRLTADDARLGWVKGGWVDKRIDAKLVQDAIRQNQVSIDMDAFLPWLAGRVGTYRMLRDGAESFPTPADELAHIRKLIDDIESVELRVTNLPPAANAEASYAAYKAWNDPLHDIRLRLSDDLHRMRSVLSYAADRIEPHAQGKGGRKRNIHRDDLLQAVVGKLTEMGVTGLSETRQCAADILRSCGVPVPDDGRARPGKRRAGTTGKK